MFDNTLCWQGYKEIATRLVSGSIGTTSVEDYLGLQCKILNSLFGTILQRDGMGREEGGGFRMGNTCIPVADSF